MSRGLWLFTIVVAALTCVNRASAAPDPFLRLWLRADQGVTTDGSGNVTAWADQSGNGNNATSSGTMTPTFVANSSINNGPAVRFDGLNDVLTIAHNASLNVGTQAFSVYATFSYTDNLSGTYPYALLFGKFSNSFPFAGPVVFLELSGNGVVTFRMDANNNVLSTGPANDNGVAHDWVFLRPDSTTLQVYKDGVLNSSGAVASVNANDTNPFYIGGQPLGVQPFHGDLSELRVYVPEPASLGLIAGMSLMVGIRRRV